MTVINTNVGALMARTYAARANSTMTRSMERLSSGQRINSAADDAAGLAVANKMESQSRGLKMAMRNSKDGISLVQTAESGMSQISNMMLRMRELAVQMDNGVYTANDRDNAQLEINALLAEIDKIAANTRFNDVALLDGTYDQTVRSGNTNEETIRISLNSMFAKDNGNSTSISRTRVTGPAATTAADFSIDAADLLKGRLGISATSFSSLNATDSQAVLSDAVNDSDYRQHGDNILLLKDSISNVGYTYATVSLTDSQWEDVATNLELTKQFHQEIASLDTQSAGYTTKVSQIGAQIANLEVERSSYIGSLFHADEISAKSKFAEGLTNNSYAEIVNVYSDPGTRQTVAREIAAVEIDFKELAKTLHDSSTCAHCLSLARGGGAAAVDGGAALAGSNGWAAIKPTKTTTVAGRATAATSSSSSVQPLISGFKWNDPGDDTDHGDLDEALTYSYQHGNDAQYNYQGQGTRSTVASHGAGNEAAHNQIFELWDAVSSFSLDEVSEDGDGDPVGDLRVSFTDTMPTATAAAYAFYPSSIAQGGDIYYGNTAVDRNTNGVNGATTDTDFIDGNGAWFTALHEIGHALGLSHPFDGASSDGSTLNLNLDSQRNTVMTYVNIDRNVRLINNGASASADYISTSTPGLLDIEAMEHLYGTTNWSYNNGNDSVYGASTDDGFNDFDNNYDSIRTIVDSGGTGDTLDASRVTDTGSIINLTPGTYSSINYYATDALKIAKVANGSSTFQTFFTNTIATQDALASAQNDYYSGYTRESLYRGQDNVGIAHNTFIENAKGGGGADTITGNSKGNVLTGNAGDDTIDGATGTDIAAFTRNKSDYTISGSSTITVQANAGTDGTDTLTNIEILRFADGDYAVADLSTNLGVGGGSVADAADVVVTGGAAYGDGAANANGMVLTQIKLITQADAKNAITVLDRSLEQISTGRAKLGAVSNRLTHNLDNQTQASMMTQQARGRVVDTDMAIESTKLAQEMILSQAAQQAINMATQRQKTVLQLLET